MAFDQLNYVFNLLGSLVVFGFNLLGSFVAFGFNFFFIIYFSMPRLSENIFKLSK